MLTDTLVLTDRDKLAELLGMFIADGLDYMEALPGSGVSGLGWALSAGSHFMPGTLRDWGVTATDMFAIDRLPVLSEPQAGAIALLADRCVTAVFGDMTDAQWECALVMVREWRKLPASLAECVRLLVP